MLKLPINKINNWFGKFATKMVVSRTRTLSSTGINCVAFS